MKKYLGVSLIALAALSFGATQAKADAVADAELDITSAVLSGDGLAGIDPNSIAFNNTQTGSLSFGAINGTSQSVTPLSYTGTTDQQWVQSLGNPATNGATATSSLTGNIFTGQVTSDTASTVNLVNGYTSGGNASSSGTTATFNFSTAALQGPGTLTLELQGVVEAYASVSNSNNKTQSAFATTAFTITLKNLTTGATTTYTPAQLNFDASALGTSLTDDETAGTDGALYQNFDIPLDFTLSSDSEYKLTIAQSISTSGTALPEPGSLAVFGAGLLALGGLAYARRRKDELC